MPTERLRVAEVRNAVRQLVYNDQSLTVQSGSVGCVSHLHLLGPGGDLIFRDPRNGTPRGAKEGRIESHKNISTYETTSPPLSTPSGRTV
eukprot:2112776-Prymnesium_polylepis.1